MLNKVQLIGNVGQDPEVNHTTGGQKYAKFSLATSETYKDKDGNKQTKTEWHNVVIWRKLADVVEKWVKKGSKLYIEGKISYRSYEKNGETKYFTEILGINLIMLGEKQQQTNSIPEPKEPNFEEGGDDLPF